MCWRCMTRRIRGRSEGTAVLQNRAAKVMVLLGVGALTVGLFGLSYTHLGDRCVLYYYGASPAEVAQGTAVALLNPFRDRADEHNAEQLIHDLRTNQCEQIVRERLQTNPNEVCPVMRDTTRASLIWLDPVPSFQSSAPSRQLIFDLPEARARLAVYLNRDEVGWGVSTVSVTQ